MTIRPALARAALLLALTVVPSLRAEAQPAVATLTGRIIDPQAAPAAGAAVTVRSDATAATWTAISSADGRFSVPMLPPGSSTAEVQHPGFTAWPSGRCRRR